MTPAAPVETPVALSKTFADYALKAGLSEALAQVGFTTPTAIQNAVYAHVLVDTPPDLLALAPTGTGKTGAFGIPLMNSLSKDIKAIQALVLCPTRELCNQVAQNLKKFATSQGLKVTSISGGESYRTQRMELQTANIVVATPGRLIDWIEQKGMDLSTVKYLILDEADEMLKVGFEEAMRQVRKECSNPELVSWMFSATMNRGIEGLINSILKKPVRLDLRNTGEKLKIKIKLTILPMRDWIEGLRRCLKAEEDFYGLIFCRTKQEVSNVERLLITAGVKAGSLHGDKSQDERKSTLQALRDRRLQIVVATDVAARGLDINDLTHVVNLGVPDHLESFTHRIGRTGRQGKEGEAWIFADPRERTDLARLESRLKVNFEVLNIPSSDDLLQKRWTQMLTKWMAKGVQMKNLENKMPQLEGLTLMDLTPAATQMLIGALVEKEPDLIKRDQFELQSMPWSSGRERDQRRDRRTDGNRFYQTRTERTDDRGQGSRDGAEGEQRRERNYRSGGPSQSGGYRRGAGSDFRPARASGGPSSRFSRGGGAGASEGRSYGGPASRPARPSSQRTERY
jgi:ATP-dependent RNA helicase DeaD